MHVSYICVYNIYKLTGCPPKIKLCPLRCPPTDRPLATPMTAGFSRPSRHSKKTCVSYVKRTQVKHCVAKGTVEKRS